MESRNYYFDSTAVAPRVAPSVCTRIIRYMVVNILLVAVTSIMALLAIGVVWSWTKLLFAPIDEALAARFSREMRDIDQYMRELGVTEEIESCQASKTLTERHPK